MRCKPSLTKPHPATARRLPPCSPGGGDNRLQPTALDCQSATFCLPSKFPSPKAAASHARGEIKPDQAAINDMLSQCARGCGMELPRAAQPVIVLLQSSCCCACRDGSMPCRYGQVQAARRHCQTGSARTCTPVSSASRQALPVVSFLPQAQGRNGLHIDGRARQTFVHLIACLPQCCCLQICSCGLSHPQA